jgi:hypothetical protein
MRAPVKYLEKGLSQAANGFWSVFQLVYRLRQNPSFTPRWSDKPLLKSWEKTKPPLGWPRETDSLCPVCVREARKEILGGRKDLHVLLTEKVGEIKHMTATLTKWYEEHGRHEIFAGGRSVTLASAEHSLRLNPEAVAAAAQTDLVEAGIARTAREEKLMARQKVREGDGHDAAYHARMAELYRQHILKEKPAPPVMRIQGLSRAQASSEAAPDKAGEKVPQPV